MGIQTRKHCPCPCPMMRVGEAHVSEIRHVNEEAGGQRCGGGGRSAAAPSCPSFRHVPWSSDTLSKGFLSLPWGNKAPVFSEMGSRGALSLEGPSIVPVTLQSPGDAGPANDRAPASAIPLLHRAALALAASWNPWQHGSFWDGAQKSCCFLKAP